MKRGEGKERQLFPVRKCRSVSFPWLQLSRWSEAVKLLQFKIVVTGSGQSLCSGVKEMKEKGFADSLARGLTPPFLVHSQGFSCFSHRLPYFLTEIFFFFLEISSLIFADNFFYLFFFLFCFVWDFSLLLRKSNDGFK